MGAVVKSDIADLNTAENWRISGKIDPAGAVHGFASKALMPCSFGPLPLFQRRLIPAGKAVQPVRPFARKLGIKGRKRLIKLQTVRIKNLRLHNTKNLCINNVIDL